LSARKKWGTDSRYGEGRDASGKRENGGDRQRIERLFIARVQRFQSIHAVGRRRKKSTEASTRLASQRTKASKNGTSSGPFW